MLKGTWQFQGQCSKSRETDLNGGGGMQPKVGHGEEQEGRMRDDSDALLRAGHEPLHELGTPRFDLLLFFSEVWTPQLIFFSLYLDSAASSQMRSLWTSTC